LLITQNSHRVFSSIKILSANSAGCQAGVFM